MSTQALQQYQFFLLAQYQFFLFRNFIQLHYLWQFSCSLKTAGEKLESPCRSQKGTKYNSQEFDKESDLYFLNARHGACPERSRRDPEIARFVTADTVIDGASSVKGWNRYMYVAGNPIKYKDPSGNFNIKSGIRGTEEGHEILSRESLKRSTFFEDRNIQGQETKDNVMRALVKGNTSNDFSYNPFALLAKHFASWNQKTHSMKSNKEQPTYKVANKAVDFIDQMVSKARYYNKEGDYEKEAYYLGKALHTIQDSFAPKHMKREKKNGAVNASSEILESYVYKGQKGHDKDADSIFTDGPKAKEGTYTPEAKAAIDAGVGFIQLYEYSIKTDQEFSKKSLKAYFEVGDYSK